MASAKFLFARNMDFKKENDRSTDAEIGCQFNNFAFSAGEISGLLSYTIVFTLFFYALLNPFHSFVELDSTFVIFRCTLLSSHTRHKN